jgi:peptidase E
MSKFFLCGGGDLKNDEKKNLLSEISNSLPHNKKNITALVIPFAKPESCWNEVFKKYQERYSKLSKIMNFIIANRDKYMKQIVDSDLIFVSGGSELLLEEFFKDIPKQAFDNKVVVGSSAGVNIFSKNYYSNDRNEIATGLNVLPIMTICHYTDEHKNRLETLSSINNNLPTYAISEGKYVVHSN